MTARNRYGPTRTDEDVFTENSTYGRHRLKERIIKKSLLEYCCSGCGITDEWNGKPIVLELDHKNGINNDNRLDNLRFMCPNCHSQEPTNSGSNRIFKKNNADVV